MENTTIDEDEAVDFLESIARDLDGNFNWDKNKFGIAVKLAKRLDKELTEKFDKISELEGEIESLKEELEGYGPS